MNDKRVFFTNFGGPGDAWFSTNPKEIKILDKSCKIAYGPPRRSVHFSIKGLQVTVFTYGIHRAIEVELPANASLPAEHLYEKLLEKSFRFSETSYSILTHNCVTAVAHTLHDLDPKLFPEYIILPWTLDSYVHPITQSGYLKAFFETYERKLPQRTFPSFGFQRAKLIEIKSLQDIMSNAYHKQPEDRERTKSTLIELGWVKEDSAGILHPTKRAPFEFRLGLLAFNKDYKAVKNLEILVKRLHLPQATIHNIFKDNPDYDTALNRVYDPALNIPPQVLSSIEALMDDWDAQQSYSDIDSDSDSESDDDNPAPSY